MPSFLIKVTDNGVPVVGAEVRIHGIGVEDTDAAGLAEISTLGPLPVPVRGARYAARVRKVSGVAVDEAMPYRVTINHPRGAAGPMLNLTPGVETIYDVSRT